MEDGISLKDCPIRGCSHKWKTEDGLRGHLYQDHKKAELVTSLIIITRILRWRKRSKHE